MDHSDEAGDERDDGATEQVEDYLRLEEHIEQLHADRRPRRPRRLTPDQVRVYQTAALFRAAAPGAADPDPAFVAQLRARLERETGQRRGARSARRGSSVSRRGLLAGGLTAAAAAAAGVVAGAALERDMAPPPPATWNAPLVSSGAGTWVAVAAVAAIPVGSVRRFVTDEVVGFVRHTASGFEALSGACTHMGCLVAWNGAARTFDCPCHGGRFLEDGWPAPTSPVAYKPLPAISTKVENGHVWIYLPTPSAGTPDPSNDTINRYGS
jgi:Rieske Fe-S protein